MSITGPIDGSTTNRPPLSCSNHGKSVRCFPVANLVANTLRVLQIEAVWLKLSHDVCRRALQSLIDGAGLGPVIESVQLNLGWEIEPESREPEGLVGSSPFRHRGI